MTALFRRTRIFRDSSFLGLATALCLSVTACLDPSEPGNLVPKTVDEDPSLPSIEIAGTKLHSESFGEPGNPLIVTIHGGPGADYASLLPLAALADDGYHVVFWDQRGTGLSRRHDYDHYNLEMYLEDLRLVIEHYSVSEQQEVVLIGHSWGAMFATWFINEYGDYGGRIRGAILSEPGAFTGEGLKKYMKKHIGSVKFFGEDLNDTTWHHQFMTAMEHERADYLSVVTTFGGTPGDQLDPDNVTPEWRGGSVVSDAMFDLVKEHGFDFTTNLDEYSHPVLFLCGELNLTMTLQHQTELAQNYPNASVTTIPGVGHEMIWERPQQYLGHTRSYLQDIGVIGGGQ